MTTGAPGAPSDAGRDPAELARLAWLSVAVDPRVAVTLAESALAGAADSATLAVAHLALGTAALELLDLGAALRSFHASVDAAREAGDARLLVEAEMLLAVELQRTGDTDAAHRLARHARRHAAGVPRALNCQGVMLERRGRIREALESYRLAIEASQAQDDPNTLVRTLLNRGVLHLYRGELTEAARDLLECEAVSQAHGLAHSGLFATANLGYLAAQQGDLVAALERLDAVSPRFEAAGGLRQGVHELDRCEVLLLAGLASEAVAAGEAAMAALRSAGIALDLAEAQVITAQAALRNADPVQAEQLAVLALPELAGHEQSPWNALAEDVIVRAHWQQGRREPALIDRAQSVAGALAGAGWATASLSARILAARLALELGERERARAVLAGLDVDARAPVALRLQAWHATALLRSADGDTRGAQRALRAGWTVLEAHRATLGAIELRVGAAAHAAEIAAFGLELAVRSERPAEVFDWAERVRAGALHQPAAFAPRDEQLAAALGELRVVAAEADALAKQGDDPRGALRRQATLEQRVRRRAQLLPASEGGQVRTARAADLPEALGDHAVVEFVESGGRLAAVTAAGGDLRLTWLGDAAAALHETASLRMALRRLALGTTIPALGAASRAAAAHASAELRAMLLAPLADRIGDRPLVVVPTGGLHGVPFGALVEPGRSFVVTPSATLWLRARAAAGAPAEGPGRAPLLVAGPRLAEADAELTDLAALYPGARVLRAAEAGVDAVRDALGGADLAHLACHGHFRADNPQFSALELADGALSVYELDGLGRVPRQLVLSACDAGRSAVHPGDELLGLAAALLRLGTQSLVASSLPVPDGATRRLMTALHRELAAGAGMAEALARARAALDPGRDDDLVAAAAFGVLGCG